MLLTPRGDVYSVSTYGSEYEMCTVCKWLVKVDNPFVLGYVESKAGDEFAV